MLRSGKIAFENSWILSETMVASAHTDLAGWTVLALGAILVSVLARRNLVPGRIILTAFTLRTILALAGYYLLALPDSGADAEMFFRQASQWSADGWTGVFAHFQSGAWLYPSLMAAIFQVFGSSHLLMVALNVVTGTLIVFVVYRLTFAISDAGAARVAGWAAACWPSLILYSSVSLRETVIVLPLMLAMLAFVQWRSTGKGYKLLVCFLLLFAATLFHTGMGVGLIAVGVVALATGIAALLRLHRSLQIVRYIPAALVAAGLAIAIFVSGYGLEKIGGSLAGFGVEVLAEAQQNRATARAAYLEGYTLTSYGDLITQAPVRILYFMFTPFPWQIGNAVDMLGLADAALYLGVIALSGVAFSSASFRKKKPIGLILVAGCIIYLFAFVTSNSGTAVRHRAKIAPILIATAAIGAPRVRRLFGDATRPVVRYGLYVNREGGRELG